MKSRTQRISIGSTLFILMLVAAVAIIRPIYLRAGEALSSLEKQLVEKVETLTGFSFSYQSLSPSILSAINIKGIVVSDTSSGKKMAEVKRVTVAYNFLDLFSLKQKGAINPAYAIRSVTINGVTVEYDMLTDKDTFMRLIAAFRKDEANRSERTLRHFDLHTFNIDLSFVVQIKNLAFHYSDQHNDVLATLKNLSLRNSFDASGITARGNGKATYVTPHVAVNGTPVVMAAQFDINGTIMPEIDGSTATVRLSGASNADVTVSRMDVLVDYNDLNLQMRSMRSTLPYAVVAQQDFRNKAFSISGTFDRFNPYQLVRMRRAPTYIKAFDGTALTGTASFSLADHAFVYRTDLFADITPTLLGGDVRLRADVTGTKERIQFDELSTTGSVVQAQFSGDFDVKRLQPSGILSCDYYVLPNGNVLSTEVYLDPLDEGFMLFSPQLFMQERSLSALEATVVPSGQSLDFTFSASDYAHTDYEETGQVTVSGSYLFGKNPYLQAQISVHNVFLDSAALTGAFFVKEGTAEKIRKAAEKLQPYIMADPFDIYVSSDFKDFTFNAPLCLVANTTKDREMLLFGVNGSNQTVQVTQFDLQYGSVSTNASLTADFSGGFDNFSFFGDFVVNAVPYRLNGNYASGWLTVAGDYDFDATVAFGEEKMGAVRFTSLPVSLGRIIGSLSTNATFTWTDGGDFTVELMQFEAEDRSGFFRTSPRLALTGTVNQYGFMMSNILYTDAISVLNGVGSILWNVNGNIFDSVHIDINAASPLTRETLSLLADVTNPSQVAFSADALRNDFYFNAQADAEAFPIARFLSEQNADNTVSAAVTASGTVTNPFVSLDVRNVSAGVYGSTLVANGSAVLEDDTVSVTGVDATWSNFRVANASVQLHANDFSGMASIPLSGVLLNERFSLPLSLRMSSMTPSQQKWQVPQSFRISIDSGAVDSPLFPHAPSFSFTLMRLPGRYTLFSSNDTSVAATILDDGSVTATVGGDLPLQFALSGQIEPKNLNLSVTGINGDLAALSSQVALPFLTFYDGTLKGAFRMSGLIADPEFTGALSVDTPDFTIPFVSKTRFSTKRVLATVGQNGLSVPQTRFSSAGGGDILVDARLEFNRWRFGTLDLNLLTPERQYVPVDMSFALIRYAGKAGVNMGITLDGNDMKIDGTVEGTEADVEIVLSSLQDSFSGDLFSLFSFVSSDTQKTETPKKKSPLAITANLDLLVGQRVEIVFKPLLRSALVPGTPLTLAFDSTANIFALKGDVSLRGGQIMWLNRNFYMKEGRILFNETQDMFDPRVTVRAETRERDTNGSPVTISLSAQNQPVSTFNPQFSATPAKSESEIMVLLGQFVSADSDNVGQLGGAAGDYLVQSIVMSRIENALRETLNFDIFSVRTNILQNAVKLNADRNSSNKQISVSNFFDNSTVYIGKYFGSSIYADAMMHWTYDETKSADDLVAGSLVFQPEFGLEMASPFVNIRWGLAPDLEAIQNNLWMPSASITLSWKFSF